MGSSHHRTLASRDAPQLVPRLSFQVWRGGRPRKGKIHYEERSHRHLPHVVKFSGGRSSGLMLLILLENGLLDASRGDVVLFTNTSAEHPATYDFVRKMKRVSESHGIPFFVAQLQTYETVSDGLWTRRLSYRLTNHLPANKQKNPDGYEYCGEVFRESIAWVGMLPTVHTRICTTNMKMFVTREFLTDWFGGAGEIPYQGHHGRTSQIDCKALYRKHLRSGGEMTAAEFNRKWDELSARPLFRPSQVFQKFTSAPVHTAVNPLLHGCVYGDRCSLFGEGAAPFLTLLGFRSGEDARYQRMLRRNRGERTAGHDSHPPGEYSYAPLFNLNINDRDVKEFWKMQPKRIRPHLPENFNLSNCVYCFLKGINNISKINHLKRQFELDLPKNIQKECRKRNTPNSLGWWVETEETFRRNARKKDSNGKDQRKFGMFGLNGTNYRTIKKNVKSIKISKGNGHSLMDDASLNCECTD